MRVTSPIILAAAMALLLGAGCQKAAPATPVTNVLTVTIPPNAPPPTTPPPTTVTPPAPPPSATNTIASTPPPQQPRVIRVVAKRWEFIPSEIRARNGEHIILEVTSADVPHGLSIPEYSINRNLAPGVTERIALTADKTGRFDFACSVFCGQGHRTMRGVLVVE